MNQPKDPPPRHDPATPLNLPPAPLRLRSGSKGVEVFDPLRRKWLVLTPEEWVRQHFVAYLTSALGVPSSRVANEQRVTLNGMARRCDTVIYSPALQPVAIVEYKAPTVPITQEVFDQIVRYNMVLRVRYLIVSNGLRHFCARVDYDSHRCTLLPSLPTYEEMCK